MKLSLAFSPCPNDCFIFDALVHSRIDTEGLSFDVRHEDVETLNKNAFEGRADVTKLSFHAYAYCADKYVLLDSGSALGRNCGPLLISKREISQEEVAEGKLKIAIPGVYTTANFLLGLAFPRATNKTPMKFSEIEDAVLSGKADAGVIIHENRFTYAENGLRKIVDLGEYWETLTGAPIPLGGIAIRRDLPAEIQLKMNRVLKASVAYAFAHPEASRPYVKSHAQEMSESVLQQHISLYVNEYSLELGEPGRSAIRLLFGKAVENGIIPAIPANLFTS